MEYRYVPVRRFQTFPNVPGGDGIVTPNNVLATQQHFPNVPGSDG